MLKIKDKLGKLIGILKDDASEPELTTEAPVAKKEGEQEDATVGRVQEGGSSSPEETA